VGGNFRELDLLQRVMSSRCSSPGAQERGSWCS